MICKGDRVEHIKNHKTGTAVRDQHETMNGHGVYVVWDQAKNGSVFPCNLKNIRKIGA